MVLTQSNISSSLEGFEHQLEALMSADRWTIAYSGGLDSHLLLIFLQQFLDRQSLEHKPELAALHINHQLHNDASDWALHCAATCRDLAVPCIIESVDIAVGGNVEAKAREARYKVFAEHIEKNNHIFLAHHLDDQVETFFYRLFRGSGLKGLTVMASHRPFFQGSLQRPLLGFSKQQLTTIAQDAGIKWVEDPSNDDHRFERNWLRHNLLPSVMKRFPAAHLSIYRTIAHLQEADMLLAEIASEDIQACDVQFDRLWQESHLDLMLLAKLSAVRQKSLLRYWLKSFDVVLSAQQTKVLFEQIIPAKADSAAQLTVAGKSLRVFQQRLYCCLVDLHSFDDMSWHCHEAILLEGFAALELDHAVDIQVDIKHRQGGESCFMANNKSHRSVKKLLQEMCVPPWHRNLMPFIYYRNELLFVGDIIRTKAADELLGKHNHLHFKDLNHRES